MKTIVSAITEVPETLRGEYAQLPDGRFALKLDDELPELTDANKSIKEFRDNNIRLLKLKDELEGRLTRFNGIDPEEYGSMKKKLAAFGEKGGVKDPADLDAKLRQAIADATGPLAEQVEMLRESKEAAERRLAYRDLEQKLQGVGLKMGVDERALPDFLNRGLEVFDLDGNAMDGETPIFSRRKPADPLSIEEWAQDLSTDAPHLFKQSKGGGATGGAGGTSKRTISADPLEIGRNLEAIARGDMTVG